MQIIVCSLDDTTEVRSANGKIAPLPISYLLTEVGYGKTYRCPCCGRTIALKRLGWQQVRLIAVNFATRPSDEKLFCPGDAPVQLWDGRWVNAADIRAGMQIRGRHGMLVVQSNKIEFMPAVEAALCVVSTVPLGNTTTNGGSNVRNS